MNVGQKYYFVSEDDLQILSIENRNYAHAKDGTSANDFFERLKRAEANCRMNPVSDDVLLILLLEPWEHRETFLDLLRKAVSKLKTRILK